jgi:hypothetical protein
MLDVINPIEVLIAREFPVTPNEMASMIGHEVFTVCTIDWYQYQVGERVKVIERLPAHFNRKPIYLYRYITKIKPEMAMLADENLITYTLEVFNNASL